MMESLKNKILKYNNYAIFILLTLLALVTYIQTYFVIHEKLQEEIDNIKKSYIENQKSLMKNQVNNLINFINTIRKEKREEIIKIMENQGDYLAYLLGQNDKNRLIPILKEFTKTNPLFKTALSDLNGHLLYTTFKDCKPQIRIKLINKLKKEHKTSILFVRKTPKGEKIAYHRIIDNKYFLSIATYQKNIDDIVKNIVIKVIYSIRFGAKNNGYISVAEILNYKGGKHFAKVIALPVKPSMVGKLLNDDKKDAKGKLYRKEYLKIANTTGEGFVEYYFYKYSDKIIRPKLSYVKLYKPFNWLIFTSVFLDDINSVINQKIKAFEEEIRRIFINYTIIFAIIYFFAYLITKYENKIIKQIIEEYERKIKQQNLKLQIQNKNLQKEVEKKTNALVKNLFTDQLTKLPNREKLIQELQNNDEFVAIININDFKEVNDFYGIEAGDKILNDFAKFLNSLYKTYKLSGDEFAITAKTPAELRKMSARIISQLKFKKFAIDEEEIKLDVNIGIGKTLSEADTALKYAKNTKKQIINYNIKLPILKEFAENLKWKKIISNAIENDNIIPYVQPIIENKTKKIYKYECLMRLKYKDNIYTPYFFLDIAKKTYQYERLQKIMIKKSFDKFSKIKKAFSINLSTSDLKNRQFIEYLVAKIKKYDVAKQLTIELLEDEELLKNKEINQNIELLHSLGVKIALDDFGSGYSNFVYIIKNLPISTLKIDGTLVKDILKDEKLYKLLEKIVEIANTFGFETIGEFVENEEIYQKLLHLGVTGSQGYYFSAPFDINELKE